MTREEWTQLVGAYAPFAHDHFLHGHFDRFEYHLTVKLAPSVPSPITSDYHDLYAVKGKYRESRYGQQLTLINYIIFSRAQLITLKLNLLNPGPPA